MDIEPTRHRLPTLLISFSVKHQSRIAVLSEILFHRIRGRHFLPVNRRYIETTAESGCIHDGLTGMGIATEKHNLHGIGACFCFHRIRSFTKDMNILPTEWVHAKQFCGRPTDGCRPSLTDSKILVTIAALSQGWQGDSVYDIDDLDDTTGR